MRLLAERQTELAEFAKRNCLPCKTGGNPLLCSNERKTRYCLYERLIGQTDIMEDRYHFVHSKGSRTVPRHYRFYRYPLKQRIIETVFSLLYWIQIYIFRR